MPPDLPSLRPKASATHAVLDHVALDTARGYLQFKPFQIAVPEKIILGMSCSGIDRFDQKCEFPSPYQSPLLVST